MQLGNTIFSMYIIILHIQSCIEKIIIDNRDSTIKFII